MNKIVSYLLYIFTILFISTAPVFAQAQPPKLTDLSGFVFRSINVFFFPFASIVAVGFMVYAGYIWMFSNGDPQKIDEARNTMTWTIIGIIALFLVRIITGILINYFGVTF